MWLRLIASLKERSRMRAEGKQMLRAVSFLLKPGFYTYDPLSKSLYAHGYGKAWKQECGFFYYGIQKRGLFLQKTARSKFADFIFFQNLLVPFRIRRGSKFSGGLAIRGTNARTIIVFDYSSGAVATWFISSDACAAHCEQRYFWQQMGFTVVPDMPEFTAGLGEFRNVVFGKYIAKQIYDRHLGLRRVFSDFIRYQSRGDCKKIMRTVRHDDVAKWYYSFNVSFPFDKTGEFVVPTCCCHGDLQPLNLLFCKGAFYYIDFESFDVHSFFFAPFRYLSDDFFSFGSSVLLDEYFNGDWDKSFESLFSANGLRFLPEKRLLYFFLFIYEFYTYNESPLPKVFADRLNGLPR